MALIIWSPLIIMGLLMFMMSRKGEVPSLLRWWKPVTKKVMSHHIDDRYTPAEKIQIDGLALTSFGITLILFLSIIEVLIDKLSWFNKTAYVISVIIAFLMIRKVAVYLLLISLKRANLLKE